MSLQVEILRESFRKVKPHIDPFVASFYEHLFTDYPEAKPLFQHSDMGKQSTMLKACLLTVVENLRRPGMLHEMLGGLGTRHVRYGALPEHYPLVGNSLLKTFEQYLQEDWTPEVKQAWVEAYDAITALMLEGANYSENMVALDAVPDSVSPVAEATAPLEAEVAPQAPATDRVPVSGKTEATLSIQSRPSPLQTTVSSPSLTEASPSSVIPESSTKSDLEPDFPVLPVAGGILGVGSIIVALLILL